MQIGVGDAWGEPLHWPPPSAKYPVPDWLHTNISDATDPDRQRWTGFAYFAWLGGYHDRTIITQPDHAYWNSTPQRKTDHDRFLRASLHTPWTIHYSGWQAITQNVGQVIGTFEQIPVVGDAVNIVSEAVAAPIHLATAIASGERLDQAFIDNFKEQLKIVKDVAPYAASVVSFVPGVGTGVAAAVGAGIALAEGQSITEAAKAALRDAVPGGTIGMAAFDAATKVASGENVGKAALESARNLVPDGPARKAFDVGVAVATGEKIQNAIAQGLSSLAPDAVQKVIDIGQKAVSNTPGLSEALKSVAPGAATSGFNLAAGLLSQSGIGEKAVAAVRNKLTVAMQQGFDAALKTQEKHITWLKNVTRLPPSAASKASSAAQAFAQQVATAQTRKPPIVSSPQPALRKPPVVHSPTVTVPTARGPSPVAYGPYPKGIGLSAPPTSGYGPYPQAGALSAPRGPRGGHHGGHGGHGFRPTAFRHGGGPGWWWGVPWSPDVVTTTETCRTWGDPIEMPPSMQTAARVALNTSGGRPTTVRGPDGVLYLFSLEGGAISARPCVAASVA